MKYVVPCIAALLLSACGKPNGISDADYATYKELGAPKVLFTCSTPAPENDPRSIQRELKINEAVAACKNDFGCLAKVARNPGDRPQDVEVNYRAGIGVNATYNKILGDAKARCYGEFSILEKKE